MAAALVGGLVVFATTGQAQTLNLTGGTIVGSLTNQELVGAFPLSDYGQNNGSISSWVISDPSLDGLGDLFVYQAVNEGVDAIDQVELTGFNSSYILYTGTYSSETGLGLSGAATPSSDGNFPYFELVGGSAASFELGSLSSVDGANTSYFLVIATDASYFTTSYGQIQDDFTAAGNTLAPSLTPVPEPSSSLMLLVGFASLYGLFRFRRVRVRFKALKKSRLFRADSGNFLAS